MDLAPDTQLLHYRITRKLGQGGMGEVWEATDTTLDRQVAIKLLPAALSGDPDRLPRFEREAKLLAALNHPNIAAIYGFHEAEGQRFLAMELVPGEDLLERIRRAALPAEEAIPIALQIAEALETAHEQGIVHRDLKPANVKLTPDGVVKVLDFGLAKALAAEPSAASGASEPGLSPTITSAGTMAGVILGTAAYMSPEQAKGKAVDRRADVWAFGVVLYQMLTGELPFERETASETLAAVMLESPDWTRLPGNTPRHVRRLMERCLERDPRQRLRDIGEARIALQRGGEAAPQADAPRRTRRPSVLPWILVAVVTLVAIVAFASRDRSRTVRSGVVRATLEPPPDHDLRHGVALSNDGATLVFAASPREGAESMLYRRDLDTTEMLPIAGSEGAESPFLSPDGRWVGFEANGMLQKLPLEGGAPIAISPGTLTLGAVWSADDSIIYGGGLGQGLLQVSASGGTPRAITTPDPTTGEVSHGQPELLDDGETVLFTIGTGEGSLVASVSLGTGEVNRILQGGQPRYLPTGHLAFTQSGQFRVVPFDDGKLEVTGEPLPLSGRAHWSNIGGMERSSFDVARNGTLVYFTATDLPLKTLVRVDRAGNESPLFPESFTWLQPRLSPDGKRVAITRFLKEKGTGEIWIVDLERGTATPLVVQGTSYTPAWSADGTRVAFVMNGNVYWKNADGSGEVEPLAEDKIYRRPASWAPDGTLAGDSWTAGGCDIFVIPPGGEPTAFAATPASEMTPRFSPDGKWLTYVSNESGRDEVYVKAFPEGGGRWQISNNGGNVPIWSGDGRELFYRTGDRLMGVEIRTDPTFHASAPRVVFEAAYYKQLIVPNYDIFPDGRSFLMLRMESGAAAPTVGLPMASRIQVVLHWFEEIERLGG